MNHGIQSLIETTDDICAPVNDADNSPVESTGIDTASDSCDSVDDDDIEDIPDMIITEEIENFVDEDYHEGMSRVNLPKNNDGHGVQYIYI